MTPPGRCDQLDLACGHDVRSRTVAETYFRAWKERDFTTLRGILADDVSFQGPLATLDNADDCVKGLEGMAQILDDIVVQHVFIDGPDVPTWFDLHTTVAPPAPTANWQHIEDGRITRIRVTFDPRALTHRGVNVRSRSARQRRPAMADPVPPSNRALLQERDAWDHLGNPDQRRPREATMARYLVVAHQTVTSPELLKVVRGVREQDTEAEFVLLVPATPVRYLLFRKGDENDAEATARRRGERARTVFTKKGVPLSDVHVGAADPAEAIDQEVAAHPGYAGFVISTLPAEKSRWLRMDLPRTVRARYGLPVHHVVAEEQHSLADLP